MDIWLGVPQIPPFDDISDVETSRIGGPILLFRECSSPKDFFKCPKCKCFDYVSLVAQLYAPRNSNDRVVYVLTCSQCSRNVGGTQPKDTKRGVEGTAATKSKTSYCFALRSQNFNRDYFEKKKAEHALLLSKAPKSEALFAEDASWGDEEQEIIEDDEEVGSSGQEELECFNEASEPDFPLAKDCVITSLHGIRYTDGVALDTIKEKLRDTKAIEDEVTKKYGDIAALIENAEGERAEDASRAEKWVEYYMNRIGNHPSQCVRWCPGGEALRTSLADISPPPCPKCGAARHFELQLTAPIVYFLTNDMGEANNKFLHFSNVLVYTCSKSCNSGEVPYAEEFVVVEDEL